MNGALIERDARIPDEVVGGLAAMASVAARGHKAGWLGYDRAYTQALPERFHLPARALGYHRVMDYRDDQPGIQANSQGAKAIHVLQTREIGG